MASLAGSVWAVDFKDDGSLIRRGIVCDVIRNQGLILDFDHPGHHADFIPWEECIKPFETDNNFTTGDHVYTLFRCSPDEPWCWYPSTILAGFASMFAFVEIDVSGDKRQEVVEWERVRAVTPYEVLPSNAFVKYEVTLPDGFPVYVDETKRVELLKMWDLATKTKGIELDGNRLTYISTSSRNVGDLSLPFFHMTRELAISESVRKRFVRSGNIQHNGVMQENSAKSKTSARAPCINAVLPFDLSYKIFMFLDADEQINCRQVCSVWESLLTSALMSVRVKIELDQYETSCQKLATMLHKMVTHSTKTLVLSNKPCTRPPLKKLGILTDPAKTPFAKVKIRIIHTMLKAKGVKIPTIILSRVGVHLGDLMKDRNVDDEMLRKKPKWEDICDKLVLEDVVVCCPFLKSSVCFITREVIDFSHGGNAQETLKKWYPEDGHCSLFREWIKQFYN